MALTSLVLAGGFALFLVVGRLPGLDAVLGDGLLFKRFLVVHVDLSLIVWFSAFEVALLGLLPRARGTGSFARHGLVLAGAGLVVLMTAAGVHDAQPILSNYIPCIDHPLFFVGLAMFFAGVGVGLLDRGAWLPSDAGAVSVLPAAAHPLVRASAGAHLIAIITFAAAWSGLRAGDAAQVRYEALFWGGGHVLQFASSAAMLAVWVTLVEMATGRPVLKRGAAVALSVAFVAPLLWAPVAALDAHDPFSASRVWFTRLMQFGIAPVVLVVLGLCVATLWRAGRAEGLRSLFAREPALLGLIASMLLAVLGFVLGAMIRTSSTMVPAHYHASIGAVTAALMTVTFRLREPFGLRLPSWPRLIGWQPVLFGVGQAVFALGFAIAGAGGMARKAYGAENVAARVDSGSAGLMVMGLGGMAAVIGGLIYMGIVLGALRARRAGKVSSVTSELRRPAWQTNTSASIPSKR